MILQAVTEHIYLVQGRNGGMFPSSHSVLIQDEEVVLIDTGCGIETLQELRERYEVDYVINSHTHPDHSAGNWVFCDKPIKVPDEGRETAGDMTALSQRFTNRELAPMLRGFMIDAMGFADCRPTGSYNARTAFRFGKTTLHPIHTPGHSKDHYCFYEPGEGILLSFDYDLTPFPWYGHYESSLGEFRDSLRRLRGLSPRVVVSAHRGIVSDQVGAEFDRYFETLDDRDERILALLGEGRNLGRLVDCAPIYGAFPYMEPVLRFWEARMIEKHLEQLEADGRVRREGDVYFRA